jgi:hypothetical protein
MLYSERFQILVVNLLEEARARAAREGLHIRFDEGFAETLPYPDASFDVVVSMFGIMFSPLPETVAVTRFKAGRAACLGQLDPSWF